MRDERMLIEMLDFLSTEEYVRLYEDLREEIHPTPKKEEQWCIE